MVIYPDKHFLRISLSLLSASLRPEQSARFVMSFNCSAMIPEIRKKQLGFIATPSQREVVANRNTVRWENANVSPVEWR